MNPNQISQILECNDLLDIRRDNVFKAVFTKNTPESQTALSKLVSALIGRNVTILTLLANEPPIGNIRDRQLRYDINCRADNGELVNVEMCFNPKTYEPVRMEFHLAKLLIGQDIRGQDKDFDDLQQSFQISIIAKERFFDDEEYKHVFEYYDPENRVSLNGRSKIITLELCKLNRIIKKPINEMSIPERWAIFFEYLTDGSKRDKINEILEQEEGIYMAGQVLMTVSRDEEERARIMRDEKIELDYHCAMVHDKRKARKEGYAEGLAEGRTEGLAEERQHFLNLLNQGLSAEEIKQRLEEQKA